MQFHKLLYVHSINWKLLLRRLTKAVPMWPQSLSSLRQHTGCLFTVKCFSAQTLPAELHLTFKGATTESPIGTHPPLSKQLQKSLGRIKTKRRLDARGKLRKWAKGFRGCMAKRGWLQMGLWSPGSFCKGWGNRWNQDAKVLVNVQFLSPTENCRVDLNCPVTEWCEHSSLFHLLRIQTETANWPSTPHGTVHGLPVPLTSRSSLAVLSFSPTLIYPLLKSSSSKT